MSENNYFGFDEEVNSESSQSKFMPAGIETGRFIEKLEFVNGPNGNYLEVSMVDNAGRTVNGRFYEPSLDGGYVKTIADLKKKGGQISKVLANLSRKFLGENYACENKESFEAFCKAILTDIGDKYKGVELRTKVILNNKNFPTLPSYAPIWEDPKSIPDSETKLVINSIDKVTASASEADKDAPRATGWTA